MSEKIRGNTARNMTIPALKMEIKTVIGGPNIYAYGVLSDGTQTGRIRLTWVGGTHEELEKELLDTLRIRRDDVKVFVDSLSQASPGSP